MGGERVWASASASGWASISAGVPIIGIRPSHLGHLQQLRADQHRAGRPDTPIKGVLPSRGPRPMPNFHRTPSAPPAHSSPHGRRCLASRLQPLPEPRTPARPFDPHTDRARTVARTARHPPRRPQPPTRARMGANGPFTDPVHPTPHVPGCTATRRPSRPTHVPPGAAQPGRTSLPPRVSPTRSITDRTSLPPTSRSFGGVIRASIFVPETATPKLLTPAGHEPDTAAQPPHRFWR